MLCLLKTLKSQDQSHLQIIESRWLGEKRFECSQDHLLCFGALNRKLYGKAHCQKKGKGVSTSIILPKMRHGAVEISLRQIVYSDGNKCSDSTPLSSLLGLSGERIFHSRLWMGSSDLGSSDGMVVEEITEGKICSFWGIHTQCIGNSVYLLSQRPTQSHSVF